MILWRFVVLLVGWIISVDVVVVGLGIVGLIIVLWLCQWVDCVLLVIKMVFDEGSICWV